MKKSVNRVSLMQLVAGVVSRMSRRKKLYCESALRLIGSGLWLESRRDVLLLDWTHLHKSVLFDSY